MTFISRLLRFRKTLLFAVLAVAFYNVAWHTPKFHVPPDVARTSMTLSVADETFNASVYAPRQVTAPPPVVIVAHGFTRSRRYMAGWGAALAGQGMLAVVINQPAFSDPPRNGRAIAELVRRIEADSTSVIGHATNGKVALVGFSMGGLSTLLAAGEASTVSAWVGLDPVDFKDRGAKVIQTLKMPQCILRAEPAAWNRNGNARKLIKQSEGPLFALKVKGATHCDVEEPTDLAGKLACGWTDPERHEVFEKYAAEFLKSVLSGDAEAGRALEEAGDDDAVAEVVRR